ncbi:S41 family peptidase [Pelagicoccus sp. SDUM812003]|uniref:S41 family peptidase n=1 Tax=Pelagicoccus sp. SDUM812003 TaxID=3041267 RepID=UPI00280F3E5C|nr:S41 family peptidase [Pelagicoccus sp. SDUM812003]MDQ8201783.1 hypothetical protein [Pelagicoccus sp. SDUM812003]
MVNVVSLLGIALAVSVAFPCWASTDRFVASWSEDLDVYRGQLESNHIDLYHRLSEEAFVQRVEAIRERLPELSRFEVIVELMRLTSDIGDSHTALPLWEISLDRYPFDLYEFEGEFRITRVDKRYESLLGAKLLRIEETDIAEAAELFADIVPFADNAQSRRSRVASYLTSSELLQGLGICEQATRARFVFELEGGALRTIVLQADANEESEYVAYRLASPDLTPPEGTKDRDLWFKTMEDGRTVYLRFHRYRSMEEMESFSRRLYMHVSDGGIQNVVIDLRGNYGGDLFAGLKIAQYLNYIDTIDWLSGVYVLTDRQTFSASMVNAVQFRQILNARIVGEPSGARPVGYQDMGQIYLPNSKLGVCYSKRLFRLQLDDTEFVQPDLVIEPSWERYSDGVDEAALVVFQALARKGER